MAGCGKRSTWIRILLLLSFDSSGGLFICQCKRFMFFTPLHVIPAYLVVIPGREVEQRPDIQTVISPP